VWRYEFTNLRTPILINLRADPFERGPESMEYEPWFFARAFVVVPAQALVAQWLQSFKEFPIRQKPASFPPRADRHAPSAPRRVLLAAGGRPPRDARATGGEPRDREEGRGRRVSGDFHFLRPAWFLALVPVALLAWGIRRREDGGRPWHGIVDPHLLPYLLSGQGKRARFGPLELLALGWCVAIVALAGPTWRREPAPFAEDTAALAIVVKVAPSMRTEDVQPDRLTRSVEKIRDLLARRRGAKTALVAYAGSAHVVMPPTTDEGIIDTFAMALDPKIMPQDGDVAAVALRLADQTLADAGAGSILWITDSIAPEQAQALAAWRKASETPVRLLAPLLGGAELSALRGAADAELVQLTPDDADVRQLARAAKFSTAATGERSDRWRESGYWLTPLLALLGLPFFRRGWMVSTAAR
jgi:Ca-activated chloride channel homolog